MLRLCQDASICITPRKPLTTLGSLISALVHLPFLIALVAAPALAQEPTRQPLDSILTEAMEGTAVPALGVLVIRNGTVVDQAVRVKRTLGGHSVSVSDRWNLGSDGKAMTATMIARLVERGILHWDTPLEQMLPELVGEMRSEYRDVTLLDLMSLRAGLPENLSDLAYFRTFFGASSPLPEQRLNYVRRAVMEAPIGPARDEASYSNTGLILAGVIAERATGQSYEQLMQREVFRPLGMRSPRFGQTPHAGETFGHVDGRVAIDTDGNPEMIVPAGGVRMSLADWARFAIDQMKGERGQGRLLKAETYRLLHAPQGETVYALGWGVAPAIAGRSGPALTHGGSDGNWFAFICLFPGSQNGVLVVANAADSMGGDVAAQAAARAIILTLAPPVSHPPDAS